MSKLINKTRFTRFANDLWDKIKRKYDVAFKEATISASDSADKKITLTRISETNPVDVSLADYARLQDRNEFKKDVSVDDAETKNNENIGTKAGMVNPAQRSLGARNLSSSLFTDGYVSKLRVYLDSAYQETQIRIHVWAIKKEATKSEDRTAKEKLLNGKQINVNSGNGKKWIDIPINETFANDTYFIFRTGSPVNVEAISSIAQENDKHVVNLVDTTPPDAANQPLTWAGEITNTTAYVEIFGRMGIADLNKKIEKVSADSSLYVKQDEVSTTSVANKVVRLGANGKLNKDMLPSIAINEYFPIEQFTHEKLQALNHFENGDVVVVTGNGADKGKRFLCVDKENNSSDFRNAFVELNAKDGVVTGVNDKTGAVVLNLEATENSLKLKIGNGSGTDVEKSVDIISDAEIEAIINGLN